MTYRILQADGTETPFTPGGRKITLAEMQSIVGGLIERVTVPGGWLWVNEDGIRLRLPLNTAASALANQPILGNVLLCQRKRR